MKLVKSKEDIVIPESMKLTALKAKLDGLDYKTTKNIEVYLEYLEQTNQLPVLLPYSPLEIKELKQPIRDEINQLEA